MERGNWLADEGFEMSKKFDENKWRILAINKPDELHSYVPQSSINELFDEIGYCEVTHYSPLPPAHESEG